VGEFYPCDYRDPGAAAARAAAREFPESRRARVAAILARQAEACGLHEASRDSLARFARPGALAVVAGQQPGLFGGPLYTLYKGLTAISLAREIEAASGRPVVPIFWIASDDHDFEEVRRTSVGDPAEPGGLEYPADGIPPGLSIARIRLSDEIEGLFAGLEAQLPPSEFRDDVVRRVREAYAPGRTWSEAFARLMGGLLAPLGALVFDPSDMEAKVEALPDFEREVETAGESSRAARTVGERLMARGYHAQVSRAGNELNLFWHEAAREAVRVGEDGALQLSGSGKRVTRNEMIQWMRERPEDVSPGVLLRPLTQDHLLPTAAYVGGPAEIAYWAQVNEVYRCFGAEPPAVAPRAGATLLEPRAARVLERFGIAWPSLAGDVEAVIGEAIRRLLPEDFPDLFAREREVQRRSYRLLEEKIAVFDPSLRAAATTAAGKVEHEGLVLEKKLMQVWKRRQEDSVQQIRKAAGLLFPKGRLQERVHSPLGYAARYGPELTARLARAVGTPGSHVLVPLGGEDP
jgi:bacillithiol biosynthesis cysteine-adding enzyme BshC